MQTGEYISYHAFYWRTAKEKFVKSILKIDGDILMEQKVKGHYLLKVSNPCHRMNDHPKWQSSNNKFWKLPTESIKTINPNTTKK